MPRSQAIIPSMSYYEDNKETILTRARSWREGKYVPRSGLVYKEWREGFSSEIKRRRQANKLFFIERLGGRCLACGVSDPRVLDFDHIEASTKVVHVTSLMTGKDRDRI